MLHRSRNSGREFAGWNQLPCGQFLHPRSLVQSSRSNQRMQSVQLVLNRILILCQQFGCRTSLCFTDQETQEENLQGGTSSLVGQFLHPRSLVQGSRSNQRMQTVQLILNRIFVFCRQFGCILGPVYASQIRRHKKRICRVEPAPLWASSYTQDLLYKAQDPFSTCRQSNCSEIKELFIFVLTIWLM